MLTLGEDAKSPYGYIRSRRMCGTRLATTCWIRQRHAILSSVRRAPFSSTLVRSERQNEHVQQLASVADRLLEHPTTHALMVERMAADEAASGQRWEIGLPETAWKHSRDDLLTSWGSFFARRGLIPASLKEIADGRQRPVDDERRLLMLLTAAYTGPLTVAKAIQELILPSMGTLDEAVPEKGQKTKKPFRPQAGHRKGMLHHQFPKLPPASAKVPKRRLEVHVLGAASQEETLLASYWPELGLLFRVLFWDS